MIEVGHVQHLQIDSLNPSLDGNTVELPVEQALFAENAVGYRTSLTFLEGRVATITRALTGE